MTLLLDETSEAVESRPRVRKAVRWVPLVGKGVGRAGQAVWRALRRSTRTRRRYMNSMTGLVPVTGSDHVVPSIPFWSVADAAAWQISTHPLLSMPNHPPTWLPAPLQQLLWPGDNTQHTADAVCDSDHASSSANSRSSRANRRCERRATRQQRKRAQQQDNSSSDFSTSFSSRSSPKSSAECVSGSSSGFHAHVLAHMINTANTFPMLLHSAQHLQEQQQQGQHNTSTSPAMPSSPQSSSDSDVSTLQDQTPVSHAQASTSSSSDVKRPQQLITVGCRHWGNAFVSGLLRVKIYDFAIYLDGREAKAHLPLTPLKLHGPSSSQTALHPQQQQQQELVAGTDHDLPGLLKSSDTPVEMSLVLKAARDVPLHLLAEEYEKVLRRRLDRVGGGPSDVTALQQLLASFSDARRLPAAVTAGGGTDDSSDTNISSTGGTSSVSGGGTKSNGGTSSVSWGGTKSNGGTSSVSWGGSKSDEKLPAAGAGGSVRKGAMIVFERSRAGDVTARVGPVILGTVSSPKVAEALFDLYLGEQPVSKSAKDAAAQTLQRIAAAPPAAAAAADADLEAGQVLQREGVKSSQQSNRSAAQQQPRQQVAAATHYLPTSNGHEIRCESEGAAGRQGWRGRRKKSKAAAGGKKGQHVAVAQQLEIEDLEACVLHMG